jgi:hypothetical protein
MDDYLAGSAERAAPLVADDCGIIIMIEAKSATLK